MLLRPKDYGWMFLSVIVLPIYFIIYLIWRLVKVVNKKVFKKY